MKVKFEKDALYGTAMIHEGDRYVLDGTAHDRDVGERTAQAERQQGRKAKVIKTPKAGVRDGQGDIRKEPFAIFVCWE